MILNVAYLFIYSHVLILINYLKSHSDSQFKATSVVFMMEVFKIVISISVLLILQRKKLRELLNFKKIKLNLNEMKVMCIPGLIDGCSNILIYIAISNLNILIFQISFMLKFVVITILDYLLLKNPIKKKSIIPLILILAAIIFAQFEPLSEISSLAIHRNPLLGLLMTIFAVVLLSINEFHLKRLWQSNQKHLHHFVTINDFWNRQLYFAIFGALIAAVLIPILSDFESHRSFMAGFNGVVWWLVLCQTMAGILASFVLMKYSLYEQCVATTVLPLVLIFVFVYLFQMVAHWPIIVATVLVSLSSGICIGIYVWQYHYQFK